MIITGLPDRLAQLYANFHPCVNSPGDPPRTRRAKSLYATDHIGVQKRGNVRLRAN